MKNTILTILLALTLWAFLAPEGGEQVTPHQTAEIVKAAKHKGKY